MNAVLECNAMEMEKRISIYSQIRLGSLKSRKSAGVRNGPDG